MAQVGGPWVGCAAVPMVWSCLCPPLRVDLHLSSSLTFEGVLVHTTASWQVSVLENRILLSCV